MTTFLRDHNKTAMLYDDKRITYRELIYHSYAFAKHFSLQPGDRVMILSENRPEWVFAFYSVWVNDGIVVPGDFTQSSSNLAGMIADCSPTVIFTSSTEFELTSKVLEQSGVKARIIQFENIKYSNNSLPEKHVSINIDAMDRTAMILYTSGTTGNAKGVMISFENILTNIKSLQDVGMITDQDTMVALLPFYHIFPLQGSVIAPFFTGVTIAFVRSLNAIEIVKILKKHKVTMFLGVPRLYEMFHASILKKVKASRIASILFFFSRIIGSQKLGRLVFRKVHQNFGKNVHSYLTGGASLDKDIAADLWALGFRLIEGYGTTETAPLIAFNNKESIRLGSVGKPLPGTEVRISNDEIIVRGKNVMRGYYRRPDETESVFKDGWYHTGDLGYFDRDGFLYIDGRKDDMIVLTNGKNIHPEPIERHLMSLSNLIKEVGVFYHGKKLCAVISPDFHSFEVRNIDRITEVITEKVISLYNDKTPSYKQIQSIVVIREEFPKTRLGKPKRYLFPELIKNNGSGAHQEEEPTYAEYLIIRKFLEEKLSTSLKSFSRFDYDLALDSLSRIEFLSFVEVTFGVILELDSMVRYNTIGGFAQMVKMAKTRIEEGEPTWKNVLETQALSSVGEKTVKTTFPLPLIHYYFKKKLGLNIVGRENLSAGPCIFAVNHQSYLDALLLATALPENILKLTYFLVKRTSVVSKLLWLLNLDRNVIYVDLKDNTKQSLQNSASVLKSGKNLVIFPEGTRSLNGTIQPFKKAFAILSSELQMPVVPVAISGAYEAMPRGSVLPANGKVVVEIGQRVFPLKKGYETIVGETLASINCMLEK